MSSHLDDKPHDKRPGRERATEIVHAGRDPAAQFGFVNPPVYRGSTVLFKDMASLESGKAPFTYGRKGTPTMRALEDALCELEGGYRTFLTASGLAAVTTALLSFARAGDHVLVVDTCYRPTRQFHDEVLAHMGVTVTFYDPMIGAGIEALLKPNTRVIYAESPGSQTFEVMDIPAVAAVARKHDIWMLLDNTWATPSFFKPFDHGVDVSIHAATKYIVGHADAMLGVMTANERAVGQLQKGHWALGANAGSEEIYLGLRGLRTLEVRLDRHQASAMEMAEWLQGRPEVEAVLHPALPSFAGHELWKRDFTGSTGLFSIVLKERRRGRLAAMLDGLKLFGMGYSWGGYESLAVPFDPAHYRTATKPRHAGCSCIRLHIGLEAVADLKVDLEAGFRRLAGVG